MATVDPTTRTRHVYKRMTSPVGKLTLVATDKGLAAILWENDRPRRVRLNVEAEEADHPVLVETERQLEEYFAGRRKQFALTLDVSGTAFQRQVWNALPDDPVWRDAIVRSDCEADRESERRSRRRRGKRQKSRFDCRAVPSRRRIHGSPHGIRRRPRRQGPSAGIGRSTGPSRHRPSLTFRNTRTASTRLVAELRVVETGGVAVVKRLAAVAICLASLCGNAMAQDAKTVIANAQKALGDLKSITYSGSAKDVAFQQCGANSTDMNCQGTHDPMRPINNYVRVIDLDGARVARRRERRTTSGPAARRR